MKYLHRLPERADRPLSLIGGIAYALGLVAGILGAWLLPAWMLAGLMAAAFVAWVVTRRPL